MSARRRPACSALRFLPFALLALAVHCSAPIRTVEVGPDATYVYLNSNAVNRKGLSSDTLLILNRFDLEQAFKDDPLAVIRQLHAVAVAQPTRDLLFTLAELCYWAGEHGDRRDCCLGAAVYAWHYLLGVEATAPPNPFDRRFRVACDIYNYGLLMALRSKDERRFDLSSGTLPLPVGHLDIGVTRPAFPWSEELFDEFVPADNLRVIGLSSRRRDAGLGVPLIAVRNAALPDDLLAGHVPPRTNLPATAFLRVDGKLADLEHGVAASLELYSAFDVRTIEVGGQRVTLECDLSARLAYQLQKSRVWDFEFGSFLSGDQWKDVTGLYMLQPYQRGKIPVVFVHGTASSPGRWAEMFNQLNSDADLRSAFQFWFFSYTTGDPVIYSASRLRDALSELIGKLDPDRSDAPLHDAVLIGHSQGGLISRMQAVRSGDVFWKNIEKSKIPLDKLSAEDRAFLEHIVRFEPQPDVDRVIFLATPHHGSVFAGSWLGGLVRKLVGKTSDVLGRFKSVVTTEEMKELLEDEMPTSVDNMEPGHPFVLALNSLEASPSVHFHSIIAVEGEGPPDDLDDGAVTYKGAHLEPVESELIVRCGHSCQGNPAVIEEVRRILLLHLRAAALPAR